MQLKDRRKAHKAKQERLLEKSHLQEAIEYIAELEARVESIKRLRASRQVFSIEPRRSSGQSEATAIAVLSDVHLGQEVRAEAVNGLNSYNLTICRERVTKFFERIVRLANKERQDVHIDELVLFLGGDLIEGSLHMDTIMASDLKGPMVQIVQVQTLVESGLKFLKAHGNFKRITVVCADGNHGRISHKLHFHSRQGNALEYYLYYNLAQRYPEFHWVIEEGILTYLRVYDKTIRFMHGDQISFGGVNGFYTYLHRRLYEWDVGTRADYTILGHLHSYTPTRRYLVNGSVVGYNPFSVGLGARFEPPAQGFMLWDKRRGPTVQMPILFT